MASIKVKFRESSVEGHEGSIYFQIIHERIVRQWYSDYKIFKEEWDSEKATVKISIDSERHLYLLSIKEKIKWNLSRFERVVNELMSTDCRFSSDDIIEKFLLHRRQQSFFNFMADAIVKLKKNGKQRTSETYSQALNSLRRFRNDEDILFEAFDTDLMEAYEAHLTSRGLIPNSRSFHMRILRAVYNRAVEKGLTKDRQPFRHVYTGVDKTTKRALNGTSREFGA